MRNADLGQIRGFAQLLPLFKRPSDGDFEDYIKPSLPLDYNAPHRTSCIAPADAEALVKALYNPEERPVVIPASDARTLEELVLAAWSQQWPALRAALRFCTGSLSNRTWGDQPFDLQVVPRKLLRDLERSAVSFVFQPIPSDVRDRSEPELWVRVGAADLVFGRSLREFLRSYGDTCAGQRSLYSKLVGLFTYFESLAPSPAGSDISEITYRVSQIFPDPACGTALKSALYGDVAFAKLERPLMSEEARLTELARTPHWASFSSDHLCLRERALALWKQHDGAQRFLVDLLDSYTNPLGEEIISGLVQAMTVTEACRMAQQRSGLIQALVVRNPSLVPSDEFWRCNLPVETFYGIFDLLKGDSAADFQADIWIPFVLESGVDEFANPLVERFGPETVRAILGRAVNYSGKEEWIPSAAWRSALSRCQPELLAALDREEYTASNRAMTLIAGLLDPHQNGLAAFGLGPWLLLIEEAANLVLAFPSAEAATFLLSLGFQRSEAEAARLTAVCFERVHESAKSDTKDPMSYRAWKAIEADVPTLSRSRNWDRCERLRRAFLARFVRNQWPLQEFVQSTSNVGTLRSVLYTCREIHGGEDFIRPVVDGVLSGSLNATEPQRELFRHTFRRNWRGELRLDL